MGNRLEGEFGSANPLEKSKGFFIGEYMAKSIKKKITPKGQAKAILSKAIPAKKKVKKIKGY